MWLVQKQIKEAFEKFGQKYKVSLVDADITPIIAGNGTNNSGGVLNCPRQTIQE